MLLDVFEAVLGNKEFELVVFGVTFTVVTSVQVGLTPPNPTFF
jgi:hypothetical protein